MLGNTAIKRVSTVLENNQRIIFAYLFGSQVKETATHLSDIDIAVYLTNPPDGDARLEILGDIIDTLKTDYVDLVILNNASLPLKIRILKASRLLVDKTPFVRHAFESATMRVYMDFFRLENRILKQRILNG